MYLLTDEELINIHGGINLTGTLINAFTGAIKVILDVSRSLGTSIRRIYDNKLCRY
ncbi:MAG: hypothetical protein PHS45_01025 [Bacilli bacterium]|nr:hypothetical protein [Bacilli bacterium]